MSNSIMQCSERSLTIAKTWERFHSGQESDLSCLAPEIAASWKRCRKLLVSPNLTHAPSTVDLFTPSEEDLIRAGDPIISLVTDAWDDQNSLIVLASSHGKILSIHGGAGAAEGAKDTNAVPGSKWDEAGAGTTTIGTGILVARPMEVKWEEHYVESFHDWVGYSAPVFDPMHQVLLGVIATSRRSQTSEPRLRHLAVDLARLVGDRVYACLIWQQSVVSRSFDEFVKRYPESGILAIDSFGYVNQFNQRAFNLLGIADENLIGRRLRDIPGLEGTFDPRRAGLGAEQALKSPRISKTVSYPVERDSRRLGTILVMVPSKDKTNLKPSKQAWNAQYSFADLIGESQKLRETVQLAAKAAATSYPVLLIGESGTGKELFAHSIHNFGDRAHGPFVSSDSGTLSPELAVAEMCGYEPGSFTGADRQTRPGLFDAAHNGTLFLDELQDMNPKVQSLLLRFLETGTFQRVGAVARVKADVRIVAACNIPVDQLKGCVRSDLLFRLNTITIKIPPLRERRQDIKVIGQGILDRDLGFAGEVDEAFWDSLGGYDWPGNVRELRNVLLRAVLTCSKNCLTLSDIPAEIRDHASGNIQEKVATPAPELDDITSAALNAAGGKIGEAARRLGIHQSTLYRRLSRRTARA